MANAKKRSRCSKWSHEETMVLAELKKETFLKKKEGRLVWEKIAQTISSRFPDQKRSHDQCRRRWETLTKIYRHIEEYCVETGQDHWQLDEDELSSMKLDTAYRQDWYNIVEQVCSQRKRREKGECTDVTAVKRSKRSEYTCSSPSTVLSEPTLGREGLYGTPSASVCEPVITTLDADHEQLSFINGQISTQASLQVEKQSPEEEIRRLRTILREKDALILELAQVRQRGEVTQQDQAAEQDGIGCELTVPRTRSSLLESLSDGQYLRATNSAGCNGFDYFDSSTCFSMPVSFPAREFWEIDFQNFTWNDDSRIYFLRRASTGGRMHDLNPPKKDPKGQGEEMFKLLAGSYNSHPWRDLWTSSKTYIHIHIYISMSFRPLHIDIVFAL